MNFYLTLLDHLEKSKAHSLNTTDFRLSDTLTTKVSASESTRVSQMPRSAH